MPKATAYQRLQVSAEGAKVPDYSVSTLRVHVSFAKVTKNVHSTPATEPSGRKINHAVSNLPDAPIRGQKLSLAEVIDRATRGELGSTEVPDNQVW